MAIATGMIWAVLLFLLAAAAGILVLQVFLSRRESGWPGLVLPAVSFFGALLPVLGMLFFGVAGANGARVWIGGTESWTAAGTRFLLFNLPTVVLLAIYFACRRGRRSSEELERMHAQELE